MEVGGEGSGDVGFGGGAEVRADIVGGGEDQDVLCGVDQRLRLKGGQGGGRGSQRGEGQGVDSRVCFQNLVRGW